MRFLGVLDSMDNFKGRGKDWQFGFDANKDKKS